jgi:hypothetical protein
VYDRTASITVMTGTVDDRGALSRAMVSGSFDKILLDDAINQYKNPGKHRVALPGLCQSYAGLFIIFLFFDLLECHLIRPG